MSKLLSVVPFALLVLGACEPRGSSRVAQGQLYSAGEPTYDAYFRDVHQQQVEAAAWPDDRRAAQRPLVSALSLTPDAPDVTLVQAAHDAATKTVKPPSSVRFDVDGTSVKVVSASGASDGGALFRAIEDTAHAQLERAKKLHALEPKLEALGKQGSDLEARAPQDFKARGSIRQREISGEISSSVQVIGDLKSRAGSEARACEDFVADLERALETASDDHSAKAKPHPKPKKDKGEEKDADEKKPRAASAPKAAPASDSPKPAPQPKPADTGEVFTP